MASYRKLPSGLWQATVYLPSGKRITETDKLKSVVKAWALKQEVDIARGAWRDPRAGRIPISEWHEKWWAARVVADSTRRTDLGVFRNHILPRWEDWPLAKVKQLDVQRWIRDMEEDGVGAHMIRYAYNLLSSLIESAIPDLLGETPCVKIKLPATDPKLPAWFTRGEIDRIQAELPPTHTAMTELMVNSGPRWGEAAAAVGRLRRDGQGNVMDWKRRRLLVSGTLTQQGEWKEYPKNSASRGEVPVPEHVCDMMLELLAGRPADSYIFVGRRRSPKTGELPTLSGANWRIVWYAAIDAANAKIEAENQRLQPDEQIPPIPRHDPHDCRHTAATWLIQMGVPVYDVKALLRHASVQTTQRYAHHAPSYASAITEGWEKFAQAAAIEAVSGSYEGTPRDLERLLHTCLRWFESDPQGAAEVLKPHWSEPGAEVIELHSGKIMTHQRRTGRLVETGKGS